MLQTEITKVQTKRMDLETQIQMLEKTSEGIIPLEKVITMRNEFVKTDTQLKTLSDNVAQLEQGMVVANSDNDCLKILNFSDAKNCLRQ